MSFTSNVYRIIYSTTLFHRSSIVYGITISKKPFLLQEKSARSWIAQIIHYNALDIWSVQEHKPFTKHLLSLTYLHALLLAL
jgi:hypothetical protein